MTTHIQEFPDNETMKKISIANAPASALGAEHPPDHAASLHAAQS